MKENFKITDKETGREYWISRSIAVVACLVTKDPETGEYYFLMTRRGPGCPDEVGKMHFPCGYLSWGETRKEAAIREVWEETGIQLNPESFEEWVTIDDPKKDARENVITRYIVRVDFSDIKKLLLETGVDLDTVSRGGEQNETDEILLFPYSDRCEYEYAFNHLSVIEDLVEHL